VVKIRMAGLWDTVGAIGKEAMAIDDHRPMFEATP
jgi:hypothetical protein